MIKRLLSCLVIAVLVVTVACSSESSDVDRDAAPPGATTDEDVKETNASYASEASGRGTNAGGSGRSEGSRKSVAGSSTAADPQSDADSPSGDTPTDSSFYPAAGKYVYAQSGYEEFCQGGTCDRRDLPPSQVIGISLDSKSDDVAVIVAKAKPSSAREVETTSRFSRSAVEILRIHNQTRLQGVTVEDQIDPDPPITTLRFPLKVGARWSGRWKDDTSGTYSVVVTDKRQLTINGKTVEVIVLESVTEFYGEYEGRSEFNVSVDPATATVVSSSGTAKIKGALGSFSTRFRSTLSSGPGY